MSRRRGTDEFLGAATSHAAVVRFGRVRRLTLGGVFGAAPWLTHQVESVRCRALELALEELRASLQQEFSTNADQPISLDKLMAYVRLHTPPE